jgi:acyl-CoA thioesterase
MMELDSIALERTHFDRTTQLLQSRTAAEGQSSFEVDLHESWSSLLGVHGGYMASLAVRAAERVAPDRAVRTIATSFLRPGAVGHAQLDVEVLRQGRSFTTLEVGLHQNGQLVCTSRVTALAARSGAEWSPPATDRPAPLDRCVAFAPPPGIRHFEQAELRLDPSTIPDGTADVARVAGHVHPLEHRPIDAAWLVMIGDWFPPSPFRRLLPPQGGVSVDYTVHLHRLPTLEQPGDSGWLQGVFVTADSSGAIALERGVLSDSDGVTIAETFHTRFTGG